jgi:hypothetical protein
LISRASGRFWVAFERLPPEIQAKARDAHRLWCENPRHPSLQFKKVSERLDIYSAHVDLNWRALCVEDDGAFIWIGPHSEYDRLLAQFRFHP